MSGRKPSASRADYPLTLSFPARWLDNDADGQVCKLTYLSFADTVANGYLLDAALTTTTIPTSD